MECVADTHALLWQLCRPEKLGASARALLAEADRGLHIVIVPAVVAAEALMVAEKGRLSGLTTAALLAHLNAMKGSATTRSAPSRRNSSLPARPLLPFQTSSIG